MLTMPFAVASCSPSFLRSMRVGLVAALATLATTLAPSAAKADTGDPSSSGYTGDVEPGPQSPRADPAQQAAADEPADNDPSALTDFRDTLDPHGTWVQDPTYGTVWVPNSAEVGSDFAPYQTSGRWTVADSGDWMWASDYDWGYVPFHYGRWVWAGSYWGWIPGRVYAPAWVTWRVGDGGYIGWAPLPPTWYWGAGGVAVGLWAAPWAAYCFVPTSTVFNNHVSTYVVRDRGVVQTAAGSTRPYTPAHPTVGHRGGAVGGPTQHKAPSPTFAAAGIPNASIPRVRTAHDARAIALSTRQPTNAGAGQRGGNGAWGGGRVTPTATPQASRGSAWHNSYDGFGRSVRSPNGHTGSQPPSGVAGRDGGSPSSYRAGRAAPQFQPSQPSHPSRHAPPPSGRAAPPQASHSPSFHTSAPAVHQAPSASRPSTTVAKPASRPSSGGSRGGGGRRR